jgi:hypothetical protein
LSEDKFKILEQFAGNSPLLKKKGVFPYEFMDCFEKLNYDKLPEKKEFYSRLNDCGISDKDYEHAKEVWKEFNCKSMKDYHDLYLLTDVLILACVMENFRDICYKNYGLDPLWNFTSPGLSWQAALKVTGVTLELITDPNMYEMVDRGIRGGISTIIHRHAKANNPGLKNYNPNVENSYIPYLDANTDGQ